MSRGKRNSGLTKEDQALWAKVMRSAAPLHPSKALTFEQAMDLGEAETSASALIKPPPRPKATPPTLTAKPTPAAPKPPALAPLERRHRQQLVRGKKAIDGRIDLHGMTQAHAYESLRGFLYYSRSRGARIVLVITGKGGGADFFSGRGVLRRQVPQWLSLPEFRTHIVGFEEAHTVHGGGGALYVRLRKSAQNQERPDR